MKPKSWMHAFTAALFFLSTALMAPGTARANSQHTTVWSALYNHSERQAELYFYEDLGGLNGLALEQKVDRMIIEMYRLVQLSQDLGAADQLAGFSPEELDQVRYGDAQAKLEFAYQIHDAVEFYQEQIARQYDTEKPLSTRGTQILYWMTQALIPLGAAVPMFTESVGQGIVLGITAGLVGYRMGRQMQESVLEKYRSYPVVQDASELQPVLKQVMVLGYVFEATQKELPPRKNSAPIICADFLSLAI